MKGSRSQTEGLAKPPVPSDIGVVAALPIEIAPLIARLSEIRKYSNERQTITEGMLHGKVVSTIVTGIGQEAARRGTNLLIDGHRPRRIFSLGFAGALNPSIKKYDIFLVNEFNDVNKRRISFHIKDDPSLISLARASIGQARLLTVDRIVRTASEKAELWNDFDADLVDMESFAIAETCANRGVRLLALRIVSDDASMDLPVEVLSIVGPSGGYRIGAAMAAIWNRPASLKTLFVLREQAIEASKRLAKVTARMIEGLAAPDGTS